MWLDFVTYLHHHGHEQQLPWYRGKDEGWSTGFYAYRGLFGSLGSGPVETTQRKSDLEDSRGYEAFHWLELFSWLLRISFWNYCVTFRVSRLKVMVISFGAAYQSSGCPVVACGFLEDGCRMAAVPDCFGFQNQLLGSGFEDFSCRDLLWVYMFFGSDRSDYLD
ncbi:fatty acid desaturase (DSD1) [Sarracenia purpurea var. burkii]